LLYSGIVTALLVLVTCVVAWINDSDGLVLTDAILIGVSTLIFAMTLLGLSGFGTHQIRENLMRPLRFASALFVWIVSILNAILVLENFPSGTPSSVQVMTGVGILIPAGVALILVTKSLSTQVPETNGQR
jgi:uncharacterized protein YhhL (DUF1145 family)